MRSRVGYILAVMLLAGGVFAYVTRDRGKDTDVLGVQLSPPSGPSAIRNGELVVRLKPEAWAGRAALHEKLGTRVSSEIEKMQLALVKLPDGLTVDEAQRAYEADPAVAYAAANLQARPFGTPDEAEFVRLWGLENKGFLPGSAADADIDATEAWDITTGSDQVLVAVIDTGVQLDHPDLAPNIRGSYDQSSGGQSSVVDDDGHGTHVAGTIGAVGNNGQGIVGVNWRVGLLAVRFDLTSYGGIQAMTWARDHGAKIINASWGGAEQCPRYFSDALSDLQSSGVLLVASAGNETSDTDASPVWPAGCPNENIISVAATTSSDEIASFSNFGATSVDIAAPGQAIYSTVPQSSYANYSGTSMAAPHVAGAAALIWSTNMGQGPLQVRGRLLASADAIPSLAGRVATGGRLNVRGALGILPGAQEQPQAAKPQPPTPPPPPAWKRIEEGAAQTAGRWAVAKGRPASGGRFRQSSAAGAAVTYRFSGSAVRWVGQTGPRGGIASLYLDGAYVGDIDLRSRGLLWQRVLFSRTGLSVGKHELRVVHTAKRRKTLTYVDAFEYA